MTDTALAGASPDQAAPGRTKRPASRPAAKPHGQWKVDGTAPLNANETWKQEDNGLNVRERIESIYAKHGFDSIDGTDLHGRFRWWGLYTQRKPGIDGGKTATLEPHELEDKYFMLRVRIDGGALTTEQLRVIGQISVDFARDSADLTDRQNIQLHWIRVEDVPEIWRRLEAVGLSTTEACGDVPRVILGSPVAGIAKDEIIDPTPLIQELAERFIGDPELANLPRKYKTAITGHPSQDVVHEINDFGLVGMVHPELGAGYDLWVGGALSTNPMLAKRLGAFVPPRAGRRRLARRHQHLPRLRLPPHAHQGPPEVPAGRLGAGEVPPDPRGRIPRLQARRRPRRAQALRPGRPRRRARTEGRQVLHRRHPAGRPALRQPAGQARGHPRGPRLPAAAHHPAPEDRGPGRGQGRGGTAGGRAGRPGPVRPPVRVPPRHHRLHRHRVLQAGHRGNQGHRRHRRRRAGTPPGRPRRQRAAAAGPVPAHQRLPQLLRPHPDRGHRPQGHDASHARRRPHPGLPGPPGRRAGFRRPRGGRPGTHRPRPEGLRRRTCPTTSSAWSASSWPTAPKARPSPSGPTPRTRRRLQ